MLVRTRSHGRLGRNPPHTSDRIPPFVNAVHLVRTFDMDKVVYSEGRTRVQRDVSILQTLVPVSSWNIIPVSDQEYTSRCCHVCSRPVEIGLVVDCATPVRLMYMIGSGGIARTALADPYI